MLGKMWESDDAADDEFEEACAVWGLRAFAVVAFLGGAGGAAAYADTDESQCPRAPLLAAFWAGAQYLGGAWLALDITACAFCMRCWWLLPRVGHFARLVSFAAWCLTIYGLAQYSMQLKVSRCWGVASIIAVVLLAVYMVAWCLWMVLVDCNYFCCNSLGEAGCDISGWLEPPEWPAAGEESDEEAGSIELEVVRQPNSRRSRSGASIGSQSPAMQGGSGGSSSARSGPRSARAGSASGCASPGVEPAVLGKSRVGSRRPCREIRVMRGGEVLHVGRTPAAVKRWASRHLKDPRGVVVVHSQSMRTPKARRSGPSPHRVATPPSPLRPPSDPPSPLRRPREPGPSGVRSAVDASVEGAPPLLEL